MNDDTIVSLVPGSDKDKLLKVHIEWDDPDMEHLEFEAIDYGFSSNSGMILVFFNDRLDASDDPIPSRIINLALVRSIQVG